MIETLFLLLPVAAFSGWWIGRRASKTSSDCPEISVDYLRGVSYLLNDQQDKALDVFVKMMETNSEVVEIHLALGNLFRRRGEVERSIRIHQNLIARPTLRREQRAQALYELAQDYMKAGLLDRAEKLFLEILDQREYAEPALQSLLIIYQQEKDWLKAIQITERLSYISIRNYHSIQSHYYCELAEEASAKKDTNAIKLYVQNAIYSDKKNVRASMLEGDMLAREGKYKAAIKSYKRVEAQDPGFLSEVVAKIASCYTSLGQASELMPYLRQIGLKYPEVLFSENVTPFVGQERHQEILEITLQRLQKDPTLEGVLRLFEEIKGDSKLLSRYSSVLVEAIAAVLIKQPKYRCTYCGFKGMTLHWTCPSCHQWGSVKPMHAISDTSPGH